MIFHSSTSYFCTVFLLILSISSSKNVNADYCGTDSVPYGMEVHHSGIARLLCSKPNCFDKNYSECPERAESLTGCSESNKWVGGIQSTVDGKLYMMCCEFDKLDEYSRVRYKDVRIRRGEFFEGEEKENTDGDVTSFDVIKDIRIHHDEKGEAYYNLTVLSFNCGDMPDVKPKWFQKRQWPYFQYEKSL